MELDTAVCLVTGASSRIGRATALKLAGRGATVVALGRNGDALDEVAATAGCDAMWPTWHEPTMCTASCRRCSRGTAGSTCS